MPTHEYFMQLAIREAKKAYAKGETPVGAVIVKDGKVVAKAHNRRETRQDALCHAEITAIRRACRRLRSWRLIGCAMYVTLEPCAMCAGAAIQARISSVRFGAYDKKAGAAGSLLDLFGQEGLNHKVEYSGGLMEEQCGELLSEFFAGLRTKK